jgi:hypothetical protein
MVELLSDEKLKQLHDTKQDLIMEFASFFVYGILPRDQHDCCNTNRNE